MVEGGEQKENSPPTGWRCSFPCNAAASGYPTTTEVTGVTATTWRGRSMRRMARPSPGTPPIRTRGTTPHRTRPKAPPASAA